MLKWTAAGSGLKFMGLVHHTDGERECAYDRQSYIGGLDKALDAASARKWVVVNMKTDWKVIYPARNNAGSKVLGVEASSPVAFAR